MSTMLTSVLMIAFFVFGKALGLPCSTESEKDPCSPSVERLIFTNDVYEKIKCGDYLSKHLASTAPKIKFPTAEENAYYTLVMVDPDAPFVDTPTKKYWLHWLITNIEGQYLKTGSDFPGGNGLYTVNRGYQGPSPPKTQPGRKENIHRYIFYLLKQESNNVNISWLTRSRGSFDLNKLFEKIGCKRTSMATYMYRSKY